MVSLKKNTEDFCIIALSVLETSTELWQQALASSSSSEQVWMFRCQPTWRRGEKQTLPVSSGIIKWDPFGGGIKEAANVCS